MQDVNIVPHLDVTGTIELCGDLGIQVGFNWLSLQLNSLTATVTFAHHTELTVVGYENVGQVNVTVPIADIKFGDIVIPVGPIPVDVVPEIVIQAGANGTVGASLYADVTQDTSATGGFSYANGQVTPIFPPPTVTFQYSVRTDAGLTATASIDANMTLLFYDIAGPYFDPQAYLQFDVSPLQNPWWTLSAGLAGPTGLQTNPELDILGFDALPKVSFPSLFDYSQVIASASGGFSPAPQLNTVVPNTAAAGSSELSLTLTGNNFVPGAVASFNGSQLATTFVDSSGSCNTSAPCLTAALPASDLATAGSFPVTVSNPDASGATSGPATFTVTGSSVTVSILPTSANVPVGTGQQFTATVKGTSNGAVSWSVNGITGGNSTFGTITQQGFYTAPGAIPNPATVTITATSQASSGVSASASVTVTTLTYNYVTIDDPLGADSVALGINGIGQIVGIYGLNPAAAAGFLYSSGSFSTIYDPAAGGQFAYEATEADGINDNGQIVGGYTDPNDVFHGFLYSGGTFSNIDDPNGTGTLGTTAYGIDDSGQIVGQYWDSGGNLHGFLYAGGSFSSIDYPGATATSASGVADTLQIVGQYADQAGNNHGFQYGEGTLFGMGTFTTIDYPGAQSTAAYGINDNGQVVGQYLDQAGKNHGFLYSGGNFTSLDYPGAQWTAAYGINDSGQIVGLYYVDISGNSNGFLATPSQ